MRTFQLIKVIVDILKMYVVPIPPVYCSGACITRIPIWQCLLYFSRFIVECKQWLECIGAHISGIENQQLSIFLVNKWITQIVFTFKLCYYIHFWPSIWLASQMFDGSKLQLIWSLSVDWPFFQPWIHLTIEGELFPDNSPITPL